MTVKNIFVKNKNRILITVFAVGFKFKEEK